MKKLLILLCVATLVLGTVKSSFALTIIQDTDSGSIQILYHSPVGQSFTATDTDIGYVGFMIEPYNQDINDLSLTMSLYEGAGDFSSPLLTKSFSLSNNYFDWLDLDVSAYSFTQNAVYTVGISNDTVEWGVSINWGGNPYSGGMAYLYLDNGGTSSSSDLRFRVGPVGQNPVPEPSTILLIGIGLLGLMGYSRKRLKKS